MMMMMMTQPGFVGGTLDRADAVRNDAAQLSRAFADPRARLLVLDGLDPVGEGEMLAMRAMPVDAPSDAYALLGVSADGPIFARLDPDIPHGGGSSPGVWQMAGTLAPDQLALYGTARSLIDWHRRHRYCANCGHGTRPAKAGWSRRCVDSKGGSDSSGASDGARGAACGAEHFPRVDPVTIMLPQHGGRILLGRQARFPAGRYSALAGFVEPGETVEEAVARELWEEAGISVRNVRYVMSQPWPFPSSLMIACMAEAIDDALTIDTTEIEEAIWVDADGVRAALAGEADAPFIAPPPLAVAHHLLLHWLDAQELRA